METGLIFVGVPLVLIVVLAALPTGPIALGGLVLGVAGTLATLVWIGDDGTGFGPLLSGILAMAVALAGLVQLSRHQRKGAGPVALALIIACLAVLAGLSVWKILQV